ncbi:MAG: response regulator transcription factor [Hyphomonadaceae bacterium]|nr:response regulator transcription factor [Hyphomonadaceae bacterium]
MTSRHAILIVDDEEQIQRMLRPTLLAQDYDVFAAADGGEALSLLQQHPISALILDLGLPDRDGKEIIAHVRKTSSVPIIVLSARGSVDEKVLCLDLGANDYVAKPFPVGELLARLRVALRGRGAPSLDQFSQGALSIDFAKRRLALHGRQFRLSARECDLLKVLLRANGEIVGHQQIIAAVWPDNAGADAQYVRVLVNQLRQKLETSLPGADFPGANFLVTEPGFGYRAALDVL